MENLIQTVEAIIFSAGTEIKKKDILISQQHNEETFHKIKRRHKQKYLNKHGSYYKKIRVQIHKLNHKLKKYV